VSKLKLIDIHTHIYPNDIALKATESVQDFYGVGSHSMSGRVDELLQRGKEAGIDRFTVLPVAIRADRVRNINEFILEQTSRHKEFIGFGTVHAAMENPAGEVQWIWQQGLKGIKMHPDSQRFAIDDPRLFPVYEEARGRMPVLLHMGDHRYDYSHPIKLRKILRMFPGLQTVAAHFGGYSMYEAACEHLLDTDCVLDISSSMMFMPEGEAERYINIYGAERMAFGTDYPMWDPVKETRRFLELKLTPQQLEQIGFKTAARLLHLPQEAL
jgi:predicted TIM-barrel fold metal-dependent hydrolase